MTIQLIEAKLRKIDAERERLHRELETRRLKQFTSLPAKVGLRNVDQLIISLAPYASAQLRARLTVNGTAAASRPGRPSSSKTVGSARNGSTGRRNARYTDQQRAAVKEALAKGDRTVAQISKALGVAEPSIIDWKKKWGLVKKRKKSAAAKKK